MTLNNNAPFLPASIVLPEDPRELLIRLTLYLNDISYRLNSREISTYALNEIVTGENWFVLLNPATLSTSNLITRGGFRTTYYFPAITAPGTTSLAHNLGSLTNFTFTHIYGTLNLNSGPLFCGIPQGAPDDVEITVDGTNVNIIAATGTYNGASAIVVLEYLKN